LKLDELFDERLALLQFLQLWGHRWVGRCEGIELRLEGHSSFEQPKAHLFLFELHFQAGSGFHRDVGGPEPESVQSARKKTR